MTLSLVASLGFIFHCLRETDLSRVEASRRTMDMHPELELTTRSHVTTLVTVLNHIRVGNAICTHGGVFAAEPVLVRDRKVQGLTCEILRVQSRDDRSSAHRMMSILDVDDRRDMLTFLSYTRRAESDDLQFSSLRRFTEALEGCRFSRFKYRRC